MSGWIAGITAVVGAASAISQNNQAKKAASANAQAQAQAQANADKQAKAAEEQTNRASQKRPDTNALLSAAQSSGAAGNSGTMLTGSQGVSGGNLNLGKSTLLGE